MLSIQLEFQYLSRLTNNNVYANRANQATTASLAVRVLIMRSLFGIRNLLLSVRSMLLMQVDESVTFSFCLINGISYLIWHVFFTATSPRAADEAMRRIATRSTFAPTV